MPPSPGGLPRSGAYPPAGRRRRAEPASANSASSPAGSATPSRSAPAASARCASASERMPPCALTTRSGDSSARSASIAAGVAPSGPESGCADDAVAPGGLHQPRGQSPGRGLQVAGLDHRAYDDVPALRRGGVRCCDGPRELVARGREIAVGEQRQRDDDIEDVRAVADRLRTARRHRGCALGAERQSDRRHHAHRAPPDLCARRRDERRQDHHRPARELPRALRQPVHVGDLRGGPDERGLERAGELLLRAAHRPNRSRSESSRLQPRRTLTLRSR